MPPDEILIPIVNFPADFAAVYRLLQIGRQVEIGGYTMFQWAWFLFTFLMAAAVVRFLIAQVQHLMGISSVAASGVDGLVDGWGSSDDTDAMLSEEDDPGVGSDEDLSIDDIL